MTRTRIVATLGPATNTSEKIRALIKQAERDVVEEVNGGIELGHLADRPVASVETRDAAGVDKDERPVRPPVGI